jgi:glycosyltransferase involved in cell wall biosynthesis
VTDVERILLVSKGLDIGGIERIVVDLAVGLTRRGVEAHVAVVNDQRLGLTAALEHHHVPLHRLGGSDRVGWGAARRLARLVADPSFDAVHVHGPVPSVIARVAPGARPVVTTLHTVWPGLHPVTRLALRSTARGDAATLAVSAAVVASMPARLAEHTSVLPHGVDMEQVAEALARVERQPVPEMTDTGCGKPEVTALVVASHRDVKNYPNLLRAVRIARDRGAPLRLVAVGEGERLQRDRQLAHDLGLAQIVTFAPPTPDILPLIASCDLLVVASDYEGQPLVVAEAQALGRPVVATAVGRVPELVSPAMGRVVRPGDPDALAAALVELSLDGELRETLGRRAREASAAWTLDHVIDAHLDLYRRVAASRHER